MRHTDAAARLNALTLRGPNHSFELARLHSHRWAIRRWAKAPQSSLKRRRCDGQRDARLAPWRDRGLDMQRCVSLGTRDHGCDAQPRSLQVTRCCEARYAVHGADTPQTYAADVQQIAFTGQLLGCWTRSSSSTLLTLEMSSHSVHISRGP